jgi:hypothetical protein
MATTQKFFTSRVQTDPTAFIGEVGRMFYNEETGAIRISDGITPGGVAATIEIHSVTDFSNTATYAKFAGTATHAAFADVSGFANSFNTNTLVANATNAQTAGTVTTPEQPAITSVGTLTNLMVASIVTATNYSGGTTLNWTPTLTFGTVQGTQTYTTRVGYYTQVGKLVIATFDIAISSLGTAAGAFSLTMTGLPKSLAGALKITTRTLSSQNAVDIMGSVTTATSIPIFGNIVVAGTISYRQIQASDLGGTAIISGTIQYIAS